MKTIIILLFLFPRYSYALLKAQTEVAPNVEYMNYFFRGYLPWFKKTFHYEPSLNNKSGDDLLKKAIRKIDHWKVHGIPELDQFLLGQGFRKDGSPFYTFRVYIHQSLQNHPYIKKNAPGISPVYVEKRPDGEVCFISFLNSDEITWEGISKDNAKKFMGHYCSSKQLKYISVIGKDDFKLPNPFHGHSEYEIRTYTKDALMEGFYFVKNTHLLRISRNHYPFVHAHGQELFAPFDKYNVDRNGNIIIFYP